MRGARRRRCAIQSGSGGSILLIPREGGYLFRMYVDLGEVPADDNGKVTNWRFRVNLLQQLGHVGLVARRVSAWRAERPRG